MRYNYPISSQELIDEIDSIYDLQIYMLGYENSSGVMLYSGVYHNIEASGINIFSSGYTTFEDLNPYFGKLNYIISKSTSNNRK